MQDKTATKTTKYINLEVETCFMHDWGGVGRIAAGELAHRKNGLVTIPFTAGDKFVKDTLISGEAFLPKSHK